MTPARPLRPLTLGMTAEIGVRILRRHVGSLLLIAAVFQVPTALLTTAAGIGLADTMADIVPGLTSGEVVQIGPLGPADTERLAWSLGLVFLASALAGVLNAISALAFAAVVAADHDGRAVRTTDAIVVALRRALVTLGVVVVTTVVTVAVAAVGMGAAAASLALLPPGPGGGGPGLFLALVAIVATAGALVVLSIRWAVALPVAALEAHGPVATVGRSWRLTARHGWRTLAVLIGSGLAAWVLGTIVSQVLGILLVDLPGADVDLGLLPALLVGVLGTVIVAPIVPVLVAVLYHDLRSRRDGLATPAPAPVSAGPEPPTG